MLNSVSASKAKPAAPGKPPTRLGPFEERRQMRRAVAEFFTANPDRMHFALACGDDLIVTAEKGGDFVAWRTRLLPQRAAEFLAVDHGEAGARAFKAMLDANYDHQVVRGQYAETIWLDGQGGYEISSVEIGGTRT